MEMQSSHTVVTEENVILKVHESDEEKVCSTQKLCK